MLLHSNNITRILNVSKVLSMDLLNTKLKFLVPLSILAGNDYINESLGEYEIQPDSTTGSWAL